MMTTTTRFTATLLCGLAMVWGAAGACADNALAGVTGYTYSLQPDTSYKDNSPTSKLTDGNTAWSFAQTVGWTLSPTDTAKQTQVVFDMGQTTDLASLRTWWVRWDLSAANIPERVFSDISQDGTNWTACSDLNIKTDGGDMKVATLDARFDTPKSARYLRLTLPLTGSGGHYLSEVAAYSPGTRDDVLIGMPYSIAGGTPNGENRDVKDRKLTDGLHPNDPTASVQWNMQTITPQGANPAVTFNFERPTSVRNVATYWLRNEAAGMMLPEIVNVYGIETGGTAYTLLGTLTDRTQQDKSVSRLAWETEDTAADTTTWQTLQFVFNRGISNSGVCSLVDVEAFGRPYALPEDLNTQLAFVMNLTALNDVFFRPTGVFGNRVAMAPKPADYPKVVKALHDTYFANTLYIEYNGEVDRATALQYFKIWGDACKEYNVEMVPCIGLVQWDYLRNVNPAAEYSTNFYTVSPLLDVTNTAACAYFKQFLTDVIAQNPEVRRASAMDLNQYYISKGSGYPRTLTQLQTFATAVMQGAPGKPGVAIFQQPFNASCASAIATTTNRVLDTYCFLFDETWSQLATYAQAEVACAADVEGDLVIVTDPGEMLSPAVQILAARTIKNAGAGLSLDLIITSAVAYDFKNENFFADLIDDNYYQGYYRNPFEAVRQQYQMHHVPAAPPADVSDWSQY